MHGGHRPPSYGARRGLAAPQATERHPMRDFEVEEHLTDDGALLVVSTKRGLTFENGERTMEIVVRSDYGPRIGERVMIGRHLVKVSQRRYDSGHNLMLMDEDTKAWFRWES